MSALDDARQTLRLANSPSYAWRMAEALVAIHELVAEQAEDEALWTLNLDGSLPISEAYLQQELRRLHALIEAS